MQSVRRCVLIYSTSHVLNSNLVENLVGFGTFGDIYRYFDEIWWILENFG